MGSPRVIAICAALLAATILVGEPFAASPRERLKAKAAQEQQVLQQVNALDAKFGRTVEAWNGARYELDKTRRQLASDRAALRFAERQQKLAIARVKARLIALYESSDDPTTISVLFGSSTLSDMLGRLDAAQTISNADHNLAVETTAARVRYAAAERRTRALEQRRAVAVKQLSAQRQQIESMLGQRRQLLSSIQSQITTLKAQEARRQAALAAAARARLAREQAALRQQAAAQAAARAAAARSAARSASLPDPAAPPATSAPAASPTPTSTPPPAPATLVGGGHTNAATIAMQYLGVPYVWGGATPAGFDCSGLVMYVFAQLGISLPHYAAAQYGFGTPVPADQLQPGDLVFFDGLGHVGIYIGGGQMIHAPHTGDVVKISPISEFGSSYVGARRI
ncbi:MAG TPA: NlpC/P60 family protein [Gaiellaceae bacterium]|jgi:cell wall-associated NlpC family hydrolase|nr:NlpC/P60 family protein [Gaiellaceae bacterium]